MSDFVKLTRAPDGAPLYVKKEMVAVVTPFRGVTHVVLTNEDVDYEVKESPEQVLRKLEGEKPDESLTINNQSGIVKEGRRPCDILRKLKEKRNGV
jgi:hypothetical protein